MSQNMILNPIFADHMVLQWGKPARFFGEGKGEGYVKILDKTVPIECEKEGWIATLPPFSPGGPYSCEICLDGEVTFVSDIYFGEVYFISGQSNIQFKMCESEYPRDKYISDSMIRFYTLDRIEPSEYFHPCDGWVLCEAEIVEHLSAIGYHFACDMRKRADVAIGIIAGYQGASVIESWIDAEVLHRHEEIAIPIEQKHYDHICPEFSAWNADGRLFDYTIKRLAPYSLSWVIWYQGESDTTEKEAKIYCREFEIMTENWREAFRDDSLKFAVVQIADYDARRDEGWRGIQRAQEKAAQTVRDCILVECADVCESNNIHPITKHLLARRIADKICSWTKE